MKAILSILIFGLSAISFAQDPALFGHTWYLHSVADDPYPPYVISEMSPRIAPYIIISEDMGFSGSGACNSFEGVYSFLPPEEFTTIDFVATTDDCGVEEQNRFEQTYFGLISNAFNFSIIPEGDALVLWFSTPIMSYAEFKSYPLSTVQSSLNALKLFPNPAKETVILKSNQITGKLTFKIFSITNKLLLSQIVQFEKQGSISVANLASGIYFLHITDNQGNVEVRKFVKE